MFQPFQGIENKTIRKELTKKRFACAHCRNTWTALVGLAVWHKDRSENIYFQGGMESEICQTCRLRFREGQKCGSKDVYEIRFLEEIREEVPLSLKYIKKVSRE